MKAKCKFDYMEFTDGYSATHFVIHAKKFTKAQAVEIANKEIDYWGKITENDIKEGYCAFRFGVSPEWPDGCYTFAKKDSPGSFPVWIIVKSEIKNAK